MESSHLPTLAVFGGSFDPLHNGHLFMAGEILRQNHAQEVLFIPAANPPHKTDKAITPANHRLNMLATVIEKYSTLSYTDIELQRPDSLSYTIDTMEILSNLYKEYVLKFVIGMDSLQEIHTWHRASELVNNYSFIIFPRPDTQPPSRGALANSFGQVNAAKLVASIINAHSPAIASSTVRKCYHEGLSVAGLIPEAVQDYIHVNELYR